ncbi:MAG: glutamate 5-kinase [Candidatus Porifericomitaceae bacterium WSBS_2022_MAG_OTU9]
MSENTIWVVKIGSSLLAGDGLKHDAIARFAGEIAALADAGVGTVLVSSGAVAAGASILGCGFRPTDIAYMQAAAAVGQASVIRAYEQELSKLGRKVAQVLLTHDDVGNRTRYLNARNTLRFLLKLRVVPVVNENDTVATDEIQFGDNDTLAGLVANLVEASKLVILTDQPGLLSGDPRLVADAELVTQGIAGDPALEAMAGAGSGHGRGGMRTKLKAASIAALSGTETWIADGRNAGMLAAILAGNEGMATRLVAKGGSLAARKRWLFGLGKVHGKLFLDSGAAAHLSHHGSSLLAVGVSEVVGDFGRGELVSICSPDRVEIGRGLVNYDAAESKRIIGMKSSKIEATLGYVREHELIHRDNLALC